MLAGQTERRDVPHEEGWFEFRTLSGRELDEAEAVLTRRTMDMVKGMDLTALRSNAAAQQTETRDSYDKDTLIKYGVTAWSLDVPCDDANKAMLDAQTRNWAAGVIVEMNVRPLANGSDSGANSLTENSHRNSPSLTASTSPE